MKKKWVSVISTVLTITALAGCEYREDMTAEEMQSHKKSLLMEEVEADTSEENVEQETSEPTSGEKSLGKKMLGFVEDEYICVGNATEYVAYDGYNVRLTVNSAKTYGSKSELPEYFANSTHFISYTKPVMEDENGELIEKDVETIYVLVNVTIKNIGEDDTQFSVGNYNLCSLYEDMSGQVYELPTTRENKLSGEFDYDLENKQIGKNYYYFDMKAGEEVTTNLCFMIPKQELESELYLCNGYYLGTWEDKQKGIEYDAPAKERRYIKLEVEK